MRLARSRFAAVLAVSAAVAMTATPALARGWGGYPMPHGYHHDHGIDGGDVLAGLLIVGGIAAIASAASQSSRDREDRRAEQSGYEEPAYRSRDYDYGRDDREPDQPGYRDAGSFDSAVDACTGEVERGDRQVDSVETVERMGDRYNVAGHLRDGHGYACSIDQDGRVRSVAVDGHAVI